MVPHSGMSASQHEMSEALSGFSQCRCVMAAGVLEPAHCSLTPTLSHTDTMAITELSLKSASVCWVPATHLLLPPCPLPFPFLARTCHLPLPLHLLPRPLAWESLYPPLTLTALRLLRHSPTLVPPTPPHLPLLLPPPCQVFVLPRLLHCLQAVVRRPLPHLLLRLALLL